MQKNLDELIECLLHESESNSLDFKSEQYRFVGANDNDKSELMKDILAFANSWRRDDAYILIGVKEEKRDRHSIIGISCQLEDAHLQQFINSKSQRPIEFSYLSTVFEGKPIGIIHIPVQRERPFYLRENYGKLEKEKVYVRRGSSTAIATPDEISKMGSQRNSRSLTPDQLTTFLVQGNYDEVITKEVSCNVVNVTIPKNEELPDCGGHSSFSSFNYFHRDNKEYFRQLAQYIKVVNAVRRFKLAIKNDGTAPASAVKVIIEIDDSENNSIAVCADDFPDTPDEKEFDIGVPTIRHPMEKPDIVCKTTPSGWQFAFYFGKVHAKDKVVTKDSFYLGSYASHTVCLKVKIFTDDFSEPREEELRVAFVATERILSVGDLTVCPKRDSLLADIDKLKKRAQLPE